MQERALQRHKALFITIVNYRKDRQKFENRIFLKVTMTIAVHYLVITVCLSIASMIMIIVMGLGSCHIVLTKSVIRLRRILP
jgi:hypothetical protein